MGFLPSEVRDVAVVVTAIGWVMLITIGIWYLGYRCGYWKRVGEEKAARGIL